MSVPSPNNLPPPPPPPLDASNINLDASRMFDANGRLTEEGIPQAHTLASVFGFEIHPVDMHAYELHKEKQEKTNAEKKNTEEPIPPVEASDARDASVDGTDTVPSNLLSPGERIQVTFNGVDQLVDGATILQIHHDENGNYFYEIEYEGNRAFVPVDATHPFLAPDAAAQTGPSNTRNARETTPPAQLEDIRSLLVEGTNIPVGEIDPEYLARFPIPTYADTFLDSRYPVKVDPASVDSLTGPERLIRKFGSSAYQIHEAFFDTNSNESEANKAALEYLKRLEETGNDSQIRTLFAVEIAPDQWVDLYTKKKVNKADVDDARQHWFVNYNEFQMAWWYELINKAQNEGDFRAAVDRGLELVTSAMSRRAFGDPEGPRWTESQAFGMIKGLEFMGKPMHLSFKHALIGYNKSGALEYQGVDGVGFARELAGKFQGYAVGGLSAVDAANTAAIAEESLAALVRYKDADYDTFDGAVITERIKALKVQLRESGLDKKAIDSSPELKALKEHQEIALRLRRARFILQRLAKQVSDMRMGLMGGDAADSKQLQDALMGSAGFRTGNRNVSVHIDPRTGNLLVTGASGSLRTGGASTTAPIWEQVAVYTDAAVALDPVLRYVDRREAAMIDAEEEIRIQDWLDNQDTWKETFRQNYVQEFGREPTQRVVNRAFARAEEQKRIDIREQSTGLTEHANAKYKKLSQGERRKLRRQLKKEIRRETKKRNKTHRKNARQRAQEELREHWDKKDEERGPSRAQRRRQERQLRQQREAIENRNRQILERKAERRARFQALSGQPVSSNRITSRRHRGSGRPPVITTRPQRPQNNP